MEEPEPKAQIQAGLENLAGITEEPLKPAEMAQVQALLTVQILARVQLIHWNSGWMQVHLAVLAQLGLIAVVMEIMPLRTVLPR